MSQFTNTESEMMKIGSRQQLHKERNQKIFKQVGLVGRVKEFSQSRQGASQAEAWGHSTTNTGYVSTRLSKSRN